MRNILILAMFAASLADAAWNDYEEVRELALDADTAKAQLDDHMVLSLLRKGDDAELKSYFDGGDRMFGDSPSIGLEVQLPEGMSLNVDDGSGSISVIDAGGDVSIIDGSGSITVRGVRGSVTIDDGSGGFDVADVDGDVLILEAGSGSVKIREVKGKVDYDE